jgi:chemotaxis protein CheX
VQETDDRDSADLCTGFGCASFARCKALFERECKAGAVTRAIAQVAERVEPDEHWPGLMVTATAEVFELMAGIRVRHISDPPGRPAGNVSALIGLAGAMSAVLRVRCSPQATEHIATKMLGGGAAPEKSACQDALGEIANMVAGNFKAKITTLADVCALSVPTIVTGDDYEVRQVGKGERIETCMDCDGHAVWLTLEIST